MSAIEAAADRFVDALEHDRAWPAPGVKQSTWTRYVELLQALGIPTFGGERGGGPASFPGPVREETHGEQS